MQLLAVSYVLPPNLYPQAIQIGRLLYHCKDDLGVICGIVQTNKSGLDCYPNFAERLGFKIEVSFQSKLKGFLQRLAIYGLPFYGRCPDEFSGWVDLAADEAVTFLDKEKIKPDRLLTFGEPMSDHLVGKRLRSKLSIPWIAHFSDPWVDNPFRKYFFLSKWINRCLEKSVIRDADSIVFTSEETLELVMKKYPESWRSKAYVVAHGYQTDLYPSVPYPKKSTPLVFRYVGNFYGNRTPEPLFEGLVELQKINPRLLDGIRIELVGSTPKRMFKTPAYRALPNGLIKSTPTVSYLKSLQLMAESDLLMVIDAPNSEVSVFLPSKLIDYVGAGKPIIGLVPPGASANLIRRLGGVVADPQRTESIADMLLEAITLCHKRRETSHDSLWGEPSVREAYNIKTVARSFFDIVHQTRTNKCSL